MESIEFINKVKKIVHSNYTWENLNMWEKLNLIHNYCFINNLELERKLLMEIFYPNQQIWSATTIDVYRRYIERAGYSSKIKAGVYRILFHLPCRLSIEDVKKEGKKVSNLKPF